MPFEPIAIVGQSCILPGALTPDELWDAVLQGTALVSPVDDGYWRLDKNAILADPESQARDQTWSDRGGYVRGFEERFDPDGFLIPADEITVLDPLFQWVLHGVREALHSANMSTPRPDGQPPVGLVMGNLSYPTFGLVEYAESTWLEVQDEITPALLASAGIEPVDPRNRFSSGLPAHLAAQALNLGGDAFSLDAACASSLYAIKLACDRLQDGRNDVMVAGAVNRTDDLFIHIGFCALKAMSRQGESCPFAVAADGLVPAEGAAFVVLKRLADAVADGDEILGVIRGVGLSNDGNAGGFLSPAANGQVRAMNAAYAMSGISPGEISLLECHATGTPVGDAIEIESAAAIFADHPGLPIGSLKSNLGHLVTVAGAAGLIKVLGALRTATRPPMRQVETPISALADSPFRLLQAAEDWPTDEKSPRRAAVSAFGFGGNNAHLIVEEWNPTLSQPAPRTDDIARRRSPAFVKSRTSLAATPAVAIVDMEVRVGALENTEAFAQALLHSHGSTRLDKIDVEVKGLRFPPNDLKQTLPQQTLINEVARALAARHQALPGESTAVYVGMGCDAEVARYSVRWRLDDWAKAWAAQGQLVGDDWLQAAKAALVPSLEAAGVVGTMPNIPANRINTQLNLLGPSYTVSGEELSGVRALENAAVALRRGEIDAALVGAVDLSDEMVHRTAAAHLFDEDRQLAGDAAVMLLLKRVEDAERDGDEILAILDADAFVGRVSLPADGAVESGGSAGKDTRPTLELGLAPGLPSLTRSFGHAHAASGLMHVATTALCLRERVRLVADESGKLRPAEPWLSSAPRSARARINALGGQRGQVTLKAGDAAPASARAHVHPSLHIFSGRDAQEVLQALDRRVEFDTGPARLVIIVQGEVTLADQLARAKEALTKRVASGIKNSGVPQQLAKGVYWASAPVSGELGFVFTGAAAAYQGMGRDLLLTLPEVGEAVVEKFPCLARMQHWLEAEEHPETSDPFQILQSCSLISQVHAIITQEWLGIKPDAVLGVSSGETNSIFATGAWHDMDAMFAEMDESGMYTREIAGKYETAHRAWADRDVEEIDWVGYRVLAPIAEVEAALDGEEFAYLTMINAPADCLIAGQADACDRVIGEIGSQRAVRNDEEIIAHHPVMKSWEQPWWAIHARETAPVPGIRYYSNASGGAYSPTRERVADALTDQATSGVDFRRVVNAAWDDGVRIFVEHGPRNVCTGWVRNILGEREHFAIALDRPQNGVNQLLEAVAQLIAAGVEMDHDALMQMFAPPVAIEAAPKRHTLSFPAHYEHVKLPPFPRAANQEQVKMHFDYQFMEPAPSLPPVLNGTAKSVAPAKISPPAETPTAMPAAPSIPRAQTVAPAGPAQPAPTPQAAPPPAPVQPTPPPAEYAMPAPSDPAREQMVASLTGFHTQVSAAHQMFLDQQQRAMERLLTLRGSIGVAQADVAPAPPAPLPAIPPASVAPVEQAPVVEPVVSKLAVAEPPAPVKKPVAPPSPPTPMVEGVIVRTPPSGPTLSRAELEHVASAKISEVLGEIFDQQDGYERQVRMPMPPLLLADRVLGIDAEAGVYGEKGIIWTETDVTPNAWYLHHGRMPTGIMVESGQADLLLISYLGADFLNQSDRVYRLLGCEVTFHRGLAEVGDTLHYEIHVDGYAQQGPVRLFFFHYDCYIGDELVFSVRHGQAGFFTDAELAESKGVLWDPLTAEYDKQARLDPPTVACDRSVFSAEQIVAFSEGRLADCFGDAFWPAKSHVRTPTIASGPMLLFDDVTEFDPAGGPWQRGYLRAEQHLTADEWFFEGHFKNDPCMPGTLMLEGSLQTMSFYLTALGYTLDRDGWVFEPVPDQTYTLFSRGQAIPGAKTVVYELFVEEVHDGPIPTIFADLLATVDGLSAFHCHRMGIQLVPAYPLESRASLLEGLELADPAPERNARTPDHVYDPRSIAACAWGSPSDAFGQVFARFDGPERCPRLPGPPYLFMTRITRIDAEKAKPVAGGTLEAEYQIPPDAWYFSENANRTMPYAVLLEAALQPCGWFASYKGTVLQSDEELYFRNLDGTATQHRECFPEDGVLRTRVENTSLSRLGSMTIVGFEVECFVGDELVFEMETSFGFFPKAALASQAGLPVDDERRALLAAPSDFRVELAARPPRYCNGFLPLPGPMLLLLDRVSGYWPDAGGAGLGRVRAEVDVDPEGWMFKCHFMGDPVQPGSLGIEAMIQTLQFYMLEAGLDAGIEQPRFEPIQLAEAMTWKYRGQVVPAATRVTVEMEITDRGNTVAEDGTITAAYALATSSLWVDGLRIYEATNLGMRIVSGENDRPLSIDEVLDPASDLWLNDHCPTWTVPALAMMSMVDRLAEGALVRAPGRRVIGLRNMRVHRWLGFVDGPQSLKVAGTPVRSDMVSTQLQLWEADRTRFATVASGEVLVAEEWQIAPHVWPPLDGAEEMPDPYAAGALFHGPVYQLLTSLQMNSVGATFWLDLDRSGVPVGALNQGLMDAATHGIPHDELWRWSAEIPADVAAFPVAITEASFHGPTPTTGRVRGEARFAGFQDGNTQFPMIRIQLIIEERETGTKRGAYGEEVWAEFTLVETLFPKGPIGQVDPQARRAFLQNRVYSSDVALSTFDGTTTTLALADVRASDWLAGTIATAYDVRSSDEPADLDRMTREVAIKEHVARTLALHPAKLLVLASGMGDGGAAVFPFSSPYERPRYIEARRAEDAWHVVDAKGNVDDPQQRLDLTPVRDFWRAHANPDGSLVEDITLALMQRFVRRVELADPDAFAALQGRGVLYLANHQMDLESALFVSLTAGLQGIYTTAIARQELGESWIGPFFDICFQHPKIDDPNILLLIDRDSPEAVLTSLDTALDRVQANATSLLVHVEGKHALRAGEPVEVVSTSLIDLAVARGIPIVPVRFAGGLPVAPLDAPATFPIDYGKQDVLIGAPLLAADLAALPSAARKSAVLDALNGFGGRWRHEQPIAGDADFAAAVADWQAERGVNDVQATLYRTLAAAPNPSEETARLLAAVDGGRSIEGDDEVARWLRMCAKELFGC